MGGYSVYVVGKGKTGRFGTGDFKKRRVPYCVPALKGQDIKCFSISKSHAGCVLGKAGEVWMWGEGDYGALGRGNVSKQAVPQKIVWQKAVRFLACGDNHTLAITVQHQVYSWGKNDVGQLGTGSTSTGSPVPILVEILSDIRIANITASDNISAAISEEGDLYTWGAGPLGTGMRGNSCPTAVHMSGFPEERWASVAFGSQHAVGVSRSGLVFTWGSNSLGQLGIVPSASTPRVTEKLTPVFVSVCPEGVQIQEVAAGGYHSAAIGSDGRVYAWGANAQGQIGNGGYDELQAPTIVGGLIGARCAIRVACGDFHTLVLTAEGEVYSFGNGESYQLGLADKKSRLLPEKVMLPTSAAMLFASGDASVIITKGPGNNNNPRDKFVRTLSQNEKAFPSNAAAAAGSLTIKMSTSLPSNKGPLDTLELKRTLRTKNQTQETIQKRLSVAITSWNCNARRREAGLGDWLLEAAGLGTGQDNLPDIIAVGIQEVVKMRTDSVVMATASQMGKSHNNADAGLHLGWQQDIDRFWIPRGYERIGSKILVGVYMAIYIKNELVQHMTNVHAVLVPCGVMGKIGNKGGVAIRFNLFNTGFCFVCSHLAAGSSHEAVERRNQDWKTISSRTLFPQGLTIFDHENLFWFGDLNYRIDLSRPVVINHIESQAWNVLQRSDQLNIERLAGRVFLGFQEAALNFEPTYKYDPGTKIHDTSEKNRTPAWCDRILYRGDSIDAINYRRHEILDSDHRPISGIYQVNVDMPAPSRAPISALSVHRPPSTTPMSTVSYSPSSPPSSPPQFSFPSSLPSSAPSPIVINPRPLPRVPVSPAPPVAQVRSRPPLPPLPPLPTSPIVPIPRKKSLNDRRSVPLPQPPSLEATSAPSLPTSDTTSVTPSLLTITLREAFTMPAPPPLLRTVVPPPNPKPILRRPRSAFVIERPEPISKSTTRDSPLSISTVPVVATVNTPVLATSAFTAPVNEPILFAKVVPNANTMPRHTLDVQSYASVDDTQKNDTQKNDTLNATVSTTVSSGNASSISASQSPLPTQSSDPPTPQLDLTNTLHNTTHSTLITHTIVTDTSSTVPAETQTSKPPMATAELPSAEETTLTNPPLDPTANLAEPTPLDPTANLLEPTPLELKRATYSPAPQPAVSEQTEPALSYLNLEPTPLDSIPQVIYPLEATPPEPETAEPATPEPATSEPATSEPAMSEPAMSEPATPEPATSEPATSEPVTPTPEPAVPAKIASPQPTTPELTPQPTATTPEQTPVESVTPELALTTPLEPTPTPLEPTPPKPTLLEPTPTPLEPTPALIEPTPAPIEPTPALIEPTPAPIAPTPAPMEPSPAPLEPTPAPIEQTPAPIESTPSLMEPTPAPMEPTPAPMEPTPFSKSPKIELGLTEQPPTPAQAEAIPSVQLEKPTILDPTVVMTLPPEPNSLITKSDTIAFTTEPTLTNSQSHPVETTTSTTNQSHPVESRNNMQSISDVNTTFLPASKPAETQRDLNPVDTELTSKTQLAIEFGSVPTDNSTANKPRQGRGIQIGHTKVVPNSSSSDDIPSSNKELPETNADSEEQARLATDSRTDRAESVERVTHTFTTSNITKATRPSRAGLGHHRQQSEP